MLSLAQLSPSLLKTYFHAGSPNRIRLHPVRIYFDTSIFDEVTYDVKATLSEKISEIGGVLGLYNGFSVITLVEFLYFLVRALLIIMQGIERRFLIGQRMQDWIQFRWEVLRQRQQNLMVKKDKKRGKENAKEAERTIADTSKPQTEEIDVVDIE